MNYVIAILYGFLAQVITFLQLQGPYRYELLKNNPIAVLLAAIPIAWLFTKSTHYFYIASEGQLWPGRLIGFGIGMIVFSLLSYLLFKEPMTMKTILTLILAVIIVCLQVFWK